MRDIQIQDFGEKIGGAKKDLYALKRELKLGDIVDWSEYDREKYITKKEAFPLPDYKKLYEEGMNREVLFFIKELRDALPTKPNIYVPFGSSEEEKEKLIHKAQEDYIISIGTFYKKAMQLETIDDCFKFYEAMRSEDLPSFDWYNRKLQRTINIDSNYSYHAFLSKMRKKQFLYSDEEKILSNFSIYKYDGKNVTKEMYDTDKERLVLQNGSSKYYIYHSEQDPLEWKENTYFALDNRNHNITLSNIEDKELLKNTIVDMESNKPALKREIRKKKKLVPSQLVYIRPTAEDYRKGKNITGQDMLDVFGFRGGEFGNWEDDNDRQSNLNMSYDALKDLAKALGVDAEDISLGGQLAIAYGARGSAGAVAHFERGTNVINLTKMNGAGSLAHEWGHALDYYIASKNGNEVGFATDHPVGKLKELMHTMKYTQDGNTTEFFQNAKKLDEVYAKSGHKGYWSSDVELFARAFASYVRDQLSPAPSDYLAGHSEMAALYPISPQREERKRINEAMDAVIGELKEQGILHQMEYSSDIGDEEIVEKKTEAANTVFNICASDNLTDEKIRSKIDKRIDKEKNEFSTQFHQLKNNQLSERHPIKIGKTTNAMMLGGAKYLDVYIKQSSIANSMAEKENPVGKHSEGHKLSSDFYDSLYDDLLAPALIFRSSGNNSLVFISDKHDIDNNPILIAIALDREQRNVFINRVSTIYGRKEFDEYFEKNVKNLIGYNIEKANNLLLASQVQFPRGRSIISFDNNLPYIKNVVKLDDLKNMSSDEIKGLSIEINHKDNWIDEAQPVKMDLDEYLGRKGLSSPVSNYTLDKIKIPHGETYRQQQKRIKDTENAIEEYSQRRNSAIEEYNSKVEAGEIVPRTTMERTLLKAQGHPDNASTQAARRLLVKRGFMTKQELDENIKQWDSVPKQDVIGEKKEMKNDEQKLLEKIVQGYKQLLSLYPNLSNKWIESNADRMRNNLIDMKEQLTNNPDVVVALLPQFSEEGNPNCYDNTELWNVGWSYLERYGLSGDEKMPPAYQEIINRKETKELALSVMQNIIEYSDNRLFYTSYLKNGVVINEDIMMHYLYHYGASVQEKLDHDGYVKSPSADDFSYAAIAEHMGNGNVVRFYTTNLLNGEHREYILNENMEASYMAALKQYIKGEILTPSIGFSVDGKKAIEIAQRNEDATIVRSLRKPDAEKIGAIANYAKSIPAIADMYEKLNTYYSFLLNCVRDDIDTVPNINYSIQFRLPEDREKINLHCRMEEDRVLLSVDYMDENDSIKNDCRISVLKQDFIDKQNTEWFDQTYNSDWIKDALFEMSQGFATKISNGKSIKLFMSENFRSLIDMFKEIDDLEIEVLSTEKVDDEVAITEDISHELFEDANQYKEFAAEHKKKIGTMDVNRMPVVINAFGGPGSGKSVSCMDICQQLKKLGYNAEYVQEYAKELVYAEDWTKLDGQPDHQFDVLKEQLSRVDRLYGKVDFIVTDSPVLLNRVYNKNLTLEYDQMVTDLFNDFSNFCYFVERDDSQYQQEGRIQNLEESQQIDNNIKKLLDEKNIYYGTYNHQTIDKIVKNSINTFNRINKIQVPATEKQISYATKIAEVLNIPLPEQNTKIAYSDFINQNQQDFYKEMAATKNQEAMDTSENYLNMVKENANRLAEVPEDFYTEEILLAAVNNRGAIIRIIPNQYLTQTIVAAAVKQYGLALKYVPEQMRTKDICIEAYNSSGGKSIRYTPEDIKEVVQQQGEEIIKSQNSIMPPKRMELDDRLIARIDAQMQEHEQNSELMMKDVELAARYSKYSLRNIRILLEQNPDIIYVASAEQFRKMGYEITDNQSLSIRVPVYAKYIYENGQKIYSDQYTRQIRQAIKDKKLQEKNYLKGFSFVASVFDITQTNCRPDNYPGIYDGVQIEPEFYGEVFEALSQFVNESLDYKVVLEDAKHINLYGSIDKSGKIIRIQNDLDVVNELEQLCSCIAEIIVNSSDERNVKTEKQKLCESDMLTIMLESSIGFNNFDADQLYEHFNQYREEEANKEHPYEVKLEKTIDRVQSKLFNAYLGGIVHNLQLHLPKQQHQKDIQMQNVVKNLANIDVATNADNYDTIKENTNVFPEKTNNKDIYQETAEKIKLSNSFVPKLGIIQQDVLGDRNNYELLDVQFLDEKFVSLLEQYPDQIRREYLPLDMPVGVIIGIKKNVMDKPQYYRVTEDELVILTDEQARIINESLPETKIDTGLTMKKEYRALEMLYKSEIEFTEKLRKRFKYLQGYFDSENYLSNRLHSTAEFMARLNLLIEDLAPNHRELVKEYVFRTGNIERAYEYGDKLSRNLSAIPKMLWELRTVDSYKYMLWTIEQYERACNVSPEYCLTTGEYNTASMPVLTSNVNSLSDIQKAYKDIMIYSASETFQNYGVIQDDNNYYRIVGISLQDYKPCICLSEQKFDTLKSAINYYAENIRTENNYLRNIKSTDELLKFNQSDNATIQDINIDKMSVEDETIIFNDLKSSSVFGDKYAYLDVEPQENSNLYLSDRMGTIWKNVIQDKNDINMFEKMNLSQYHFCTNMEDFKALAKNQAIHEWKSGITNNEVYVYVVDSNLEQLPKEQYMSVYDFKKSIDTLRSVGNKDNVDITYKVITKTDTYLNRIQNDLEDVYLSVYNKAKDVKPELSRQIAKQYYQDQIDFNDTLLKPVMNSIKSQENDEQLMESAAILMNANELLDDELKKLDVAPADAEILKLQAGSINENTVRNIEQQMQQHIQQRQQVQRKQEVSIGD